MALSIKSSTILVVGAYGYLGSRIIKWLVNESGVPPSQIHGIDANGNPPSDRSVEGVVYQQVDITEREAVRNLLKDHIQPNIIFHTASPLYSSGDLDYFLRVNVEGTQNLLDAAVDATSDSVKVFVYTSSSSVVHDFYSDLVEASESYPLLFMPQQPQPYHHSKALAEQLALGYNRKRGDFVVAAIRPSAMFGPREPTMIPNMIRRAESGTLRYQIGDGTNEADFTFVDNTAYAHVLAAEALLDAVQRDAANALPEEMAVEGEVFTITNDVHPKFWDFAREVGAMAGYPTERVVKIPASIGLGVASIVEWFVWLVSFGTKKASVTRMDLHYSTITRTFDISKAKTRLGYRPRYTIEEGMKLTVAPMLADKKVD